MRTPSSGTRDAAPVSAAQAVETAPAAKANAYGILTAGAGRPVILQRQVFGAEQIAFAEAAFLRGLQVAPRGVANVHEIQSRIDKGGHATGQEIADERPHRFAAFEQEAGDVVADKIRGACDKNHPLSITLSEQELP